MTNASASQREALAKAYETGNAAEVGRLGGELLSMLPMGGGVGSLRNAGKALDEASMLGKAASAATAAERIAANQAKGMKFEEAVLAYMIETKNKQAFTTQIGEKTITVIPDSVFPSGAILEIKDVAYLTNSNQFRAYASGTATAKSGEVLSGPIELVVSPGTRISVPLERMIKVNEGTIQVFDSTLKTMSEWSRS
nr:putative toxin [Parazoarcus communis]